ncbi:transcriptional regulator TyrR [Candidatus Curculioniphilus buchneri]|uniref:transcriptional regulator TyrR n=1 Tax=Candidatus Curculioniphilus buchneri TaxID=690594 RepID=UPI00376EBEC8
MRLEVYCQNHVNLSQELLNLLTSYAIDLRSVEFTSIGRVYLNFAQLECNIFKTIISKIRSIEGVTDVHTVVTYISTEYGFHVMKAILAPMPEPVFSIDITGQIELFNPAAALLCDQKKKNLIGQMISTVISDFDFNHWLRDALPLPTSKWVMIQGQYFLLDISPILLSSDNGQSNMAGGIVMLKSIMHLNRQLKDQSIHNKNAFNRLLVNSKSMHQLLDITKKLAILDAPLLIFGEIGTGKKLLAHACHLYSVRSHHPFLVFNCATLSDERAEIELFGYATDVDPLLRKSKKGFFERANGGSILLDEISEMSPIMQNKLLHFLNCSTLYHVGEDQEIHVDVRIICTAKKNLLNLVRSGHFREDLYYRLNVLSLTIPPLREHPEDIIPLASMFIDQFCNENGVKQPKLAPDLIDKLSCYTWPGNVRQLKNILYSAIARQDGLMIHDNGIELPDFNPICSISDDLLNGSLSEISKRFERSVLVRLYRTHPSTRKLAKRLGVSHTAIANKLREYNLSAKNR